MDSSGIDGFVRISSDKGAQRRTQDDWCKPLCASCEPQGGLRGSSVGARDTELRRWVKDPVKSILLFLL